MKNILYLFFAILFSNSLMGQVLPIDPVTKKVTFGESVVVDSVSKDEMYDRSITWLTNHYKTNKFDINDKTNGKTGHEGYFVVSMTYDFKYKSEHNVSYNILINQKDGKYRYSITDFFVYNVKTGPKSIQAVEVAYPKMTTGNKKEFYTQLSNEVTLIIEDLKNTMKSGKMKDKDEW
jgi:hypothetical protein